MRRTSALSGVCSGFSWLAVSTTIQSLFRFTINRMRELSATWHRRQWRASSPFRVCLAVKKLLGAHAARTASTFSSFNMSTTRVTRTRSAREGCESMASPTSVWGFLRICCAYAHLAASRPRCSVPTTSDDEESRPVTYAHRSPSTLMRNPLLPVLHIAH